MLFVEPHQSRSSSLHGLLHYPATPTYFIHFSLNLQDKPAEHIHENGFMKFIECTANCRNPTQFTHNVLFTSTIKALVSRNRIFTLHSANVLKPVCSVCAPPKFDISSMLCSMHCKLLSLLTAGRPALTTLRPTHMPDDHPLSYGLYTCQCSADRQVAEATPLL